MDFSVSIGSILGALFIGVVSPGPSFVLVAQTSVSISRRNGVAAAFGMGVGSTCFAVLVLFGLHATLAAVPWLYMVLKIGGGVYLLYLALRIWRGAAEPLRLTGTADPLQNRWQRSFILALGTMLGNPKAVVQYGSIFAALLPRDVPLSLSLILVPLIFLMETGWYIAVALMLSSTVPRMAYLKWKIWIDRVAGGVMGLLGLKLLAASTESV